MAIAYLTRHMCSRLCHGLRRLPPCHAQGMSVVRLNMSHGDHKSHKAVVDLVREYNALDRGNLAIMLDTKGPEVRSGDLSEPIDMKAGGCPPARLHCAHAPGWPEGISPVMLNAVGLEMKAGGCRPITLAPLCAKVMCLAGQRQSHPSRRMLLGSQAACWRPASARQGGGQCASGVPPVQQPCSSCTSHSCSLLQLTIIQLIGPVAEGSHASSAACRGSIRLHD